MKHAPATAIARGGFPVRSSGVGLPDALLTRFQFKTASLHARRAISLRYISLLDASALAALPGETRGAVGCNDRARNRLAPTRCRKPLWARSNGSLIDGQRDFRRPR
jgi:hypothetical protein